MNVTITIDTETTHTVIDSSAPDTYRDLGDPEPLNLRGLFDGAVRDARRATGLDMPASA